MFDIKQEKQRKNSILNYNKMYSYLNQSRNVGEEIGRLMEFFPQLLQSNRINCSVVHSLCI